MENDIKAIEIVFDYLKHFADESGAGRAYVDLECEDGSKFSIEYKPSKKTK